MYKLFYYLFYMEKNIMCYCILTLCICYIVYNILINRTIEIERFSNEPIIYLNNGNTLKYSNKNI